MRRPGGSGPPTMTSHHEDIWPYIQVMRKQAGGARVQCAAWRMRSVVQERNGAKHGAVVGVAAARAAAAAAWCNAEAEAG